MAQCWMIAEAESEGDWKKTKSPSFFLSFFLSLHIIIIIINSKQIYLGLGMLGALKMDTNNKNKNRSTNTNTNTQRNTNINTNTNKQKQLQHIGETRCSRQSGALKVETGDLARLVMSWAVDLKCATCCLRHVLCTKVCAGAGSSATCHEHRHMSYIGVSAVIGETCMWAYATCLVVYICCTDKNAS